jgi:hypothetical protein
MENMIRSSKLHRLVKLMMDSGEAASVEEAEQILRRYRLAIQVDKGEAAFPAYQAALLTAVNTGRRCFLGGVQVSGDLDIPLRIPWRRCSILAEAINDLQGQIVSEPELGLPLIYFGDAVLDDASREFSARPVVSGWNGGILPSRDSISFSLEETFTPAGVLAGALAVSEAFQFTRGDNTLAGQRSVGLSLWRPDSKISWLDTDPGPVLDSLPSKLWLIGLGHLGQAYLWTLGFLPYPVGCEVQLVLQDIDALEDANDSTSLLTNQTLIGMKKTRAMAAWCEERGFQTSLIERRFADDFIINDTEPALALCGVDNIEARRVLDKVGFKRIIEAGLGKGTQEYLGLKIHTFPASRSTDQCWNPINKGGNPIERLIQQPAYQQLQKIGLDRCGLIEMAGHSVGASFVGAIASTLVLAQALRLLRGESTDELIDADLRSSSILSYVIRNEAQPELFNPGLIRL